MGKGCVDEGCMWGCTSEGRVGGGGGRVRGGVGVRDVGACGYKICKGSER